ncbi:hypothetical protein AB1285_17900 [Microbacterium sp. NRRL B-14842]|uniref:hypothetical protein n=1 Tax=Microbacterium sp. NRRL B-14842 TaxID=3162881 RepID=UPI003D2B5860
MDTDVPMSFASGDGKTTTTVGLDYGTWRPTPEVSIALIGIPGQQRFASARQRVSIPGTGCCSGCAATATPSSPTPTSGWTFSRARSIAS